MRARLGALEPAERLVLGWGLLMCLALFVLGAGIVYGSGAAVVLCALVAGFCFVQVERAARAGGAA